MFFEIGKFVSLGASILSLFALMGSAFFVPGASWEDRLTASLLWIALAACVCFASGILFREDAIRREPESDPPLTSTLPVRLFFWSLGVLAVLFLLGWFLDTWYVPQLWRNQP
jgi:drug/metabolite transporter (DMT)-like permease